MGSMVEKGIERKWGTEGGSGGGDCGGKGRREGGGGRKGYLNEEGGEWRER